MLYCVLTLTLMAVAGFISPVYSVSRADDRYVAAACADLIHADVRRLPGFVRVAFHDCVSGCDGCINVGLTGGHNAGLQPYLTALNNAYSQCGIASRGISRADFYAKCGQVAAEIGRDNSTSEFSSASDLWITFQYGRQDCANVADAQPVGAEDANDFPDPTMAWSHVSNWCSTVFALNTDEECVALLGAHTLGRAHPGASGFTGPWMEGNEGELHFDNGYYNALLNEDWEQVNRGSAGSPRWQYVISSTQGRLMLNTDICLVKNINPLASGRVRRDLDLITDNTDIKTVVEDYATNNINWLNKFGEAFTKMINTVPTGETYTFTDVTPSPAVIPTTQSGPNNNNVCAWARDSSV